MAGIVAGRENMQRNDDYDVDEASQQAYQGEREDIGFHGGDPYWGFFTGMCGGQSLVGNPAAVKAERDPGGEVDAGDWLAGEILCGEDDQVGGAAVRVMDECHDVAVVLGGVGGGRGEDGLAGGGIAAELVRLHRAGGQVVLEQGVGERIVGEVANRGPAAVG